MVLSKVIVVGLLLTATTIVNCSAGLPKRAFSGISKECKEEIVEDIAENDDFCNGKDLIERKLETDFDWHDIKKCCGESNNFNYVCDESTNYCATPEPESYQNPKVVPDLECPEGCYIHSKFNITDIVDKKGKTFSLNKFENIKVHDYCAIYDCEEHFGSGSGWNWKWEPRIKACLCFVNYTKEVENSYANPEHQNILEANRNCTNIQEKINAQECRNKSWIQAKSRLEDLRYENGLLMFKEDGKEKSFNDNNHCIWPKFNSFWKGEGDPLEMQITYCTQPCNGTIPCIRRCCSRNCYKNHSEMMKSYEKFATSFDIELPNLDQEYGKLPCNITKKIKIPNNFPLKRPSFSIKDDKYVMNWENKNLQRNETEFCIDYDYKPDVAYLEVCWDSAKKAWYPYVMDILHILHSTLQWN